MYYILQHFVLLFSFIFCFPYFIILEWIQFKNYRAIFEDAQQNKEYAKQKLDMPILTIGGEAGLGNATTISFQKVANNVTGMTLPNTGHFIPEERPNFLTKQILEFFK